MYCTNCNAQIPEGSTFCTNCGAQITDASSLVFCTNCGSTVAADAAACPTCGQVLGGQKKPAKKGLFVGIIAAVAVVAVVLILCFSGIFGSTSPQDAIKNTLDNGNFTVEFEIDGMGKGTVMVDMDVKKKELTVYAEVKINGEKGVFAIYDNQMVAGADGEYYVQEIDDDMMDTIFDSYASLDKSDWGELFDTIEDMTGTDVSDVLDVKKFDKCMDQFEKNLENKKWLKENAGYEVETKKGVKLHTYEPKAYDFLVASLECFEDCFEDDDIYDTLVDGLKGIKSQLKSVKVNLTIGVKGKHVHSISGDVMGFEAELNFSNIGKTKIDVKEIKDMIKEADD